jgi:two-component system, chemotaxis family, response regulator Rcp1
MNTAEILLVEDNPHDTLLVIKAIGDNPAYHLRAVDDGEQAMAYLRRQEPFANVTPPQVILLDVRLPKRNGLEILSEIKRDEALKHTPVILLTNATEEEALGRHASYVHAYIQKPLDPAKFIRVVQQAVAFCLTNYLRPPLN